jgi:L-malate glycosyltransferase
VSQFDVGVLPTTYDSESLPTTIIEYLLLGKPVIATDRGEISKMIGLPNEPAGILLNMVDGNVVENSLVAAMQTLMDNQDLYSRFSMSALKRARTFNMETCIMEYLKLYSG